MSLNIAFNVARIGLNQAEQKIAITAANISNADRAGYSRKVLASEYQNTGLVSVPFGGRAVRAFMDPLLARQVNQQATVSSYHASLSQYLSRYSQTYGGTGTQSNTLSSTLNNLTASLQILEGNPTDSSAKSKVVSTAQTITSALNQVTKSLQQERLRANNDIANCIESINQSLKQISALNNQIGIADATGISSGDLEDARDLELQNLSQLMGIQYFTDNENRVQVYTLNGGTLVGGIGHVELSYTPAGTVSGTTIYPGGFGPINLGITDITTTVTTGQLGALIKLRDETLVGEQEKLDLFAANLMDTVNAVLNKGTAYPPLTTVTGSVEGMSAGTSLAGATGNLRVAVMDKTGFVQSYADIDLSTVGSVGGLMGALNGIAGVNASLDADGRLIVTSTNPAMGISMNPMNSDIGGMGATQFFGFNNLFVNNGTTAGSITVNKELIANSSGLAIGTLSDTTPLVIGEQALSSGDATTIGSLLDAFDMPQAFSAAGNFGARTATLANYIGAIIADAAMQANSARSEADASAASFTYLSNSLSNAMGVNVDEETANLTMLQTNYQANAQLIGTIKTLFETLMRAVS